MLEEKFKKKVPIAHDVDFNRGIKIIGKLADLNTPVSFSYKRANKKREATKPKYAWITSNTCRISFCTNEFMACTAAELMMKISGHISPKDFY